MKKLIILLAMSFSLHAQTDSTKVTFSEEKVEKFEKTTLIDEYEKAFGGNRVVKSGLRIITSESDLINYSQLGFQMEKKIGPSFSILAGAGSFFRLNTSQTNLEGNLEARYYFNMKKRIEKGLQKPNITGNYVGFRAQIFKDEISNLDRILNMDGGRIQVIGGFFSDVFLEKSNFSLRVGKQFGNTLNLSLQLGVKKGYYLTPENGYKYYGKYSYPFFISLQNQVGIGVLYQGEKSKSNSYCEFLKCNFDKNNLLKLNLNNAFYVDKFTQNIKLDLAYEHKIAHSAFSINSNVFLEIKNSRLPEISHYRDTTIIISDGTEYLSKIAVFTGKKYNKPVYNYGLKEQMRYYLGQKNKVLKGEQGNNLNGYYTGVELSYHIYKTSFGNTINYLFPNRIDMKTLSGILGYQTLTNKKTFLDVNMAMGFEAIKTFGQSDLPRNWFGQTHFEIGIKLGLAR